MAKILHTDVARPSGYISVDEAVKHAKHFALPSEFPSLESYCAKFREQSRLDRIAVVDRSRAVEDFESLLETFFSETGTKRSDVRYLLSSDLYQNTMDVELSIPHYLQRRFDLETATSFAIHQGCGSAFVCMHLASRLLAEDDPDGVLLYLTSSCAPDLSERFIQTTVVGDGLGLMAISASRGPFAIRGTHSKALGEASFNKRTGTAKEIDVLSIIREGVGTIDRVLADQGLERSQVKAILPQNINHLGYVTLYASFLRVPPSLLFLENIPRGGHRGDTDTLGNLKAYQAAYPPCAGDKLVLYGLGGTIGRDKNFNSALLEFVS